MSEWSDAQGWEASWWGDCTNTFHEEQKQLVYAHRMGLEALADGGRWPVFDLDGTSVLDLGGGPVSLLLKSRGRGDRRHVVVDPGAYPEWVRERYKLKGIKWSQKPAEDYDAGGRFDEVWIYNVLQHVREPSAVIRTAQKHASRIRIFEWVDTGTNIGHPHNLTRQLLDRLLGEAGVVEQLNESGCVGKAYYSTVG
jgi:2-polyprenyl-3-methyl-5-hydroxy-6-metoxy-1,4-benzoquinol methylase